MNKLQEKELELLKEFIRICDELNLKYYVVCGTALGTIKYNGFIPWDDDVDVALFRNDYEIFKEKAPRLLQAGLFLQNYETDPKFPHLFSKLRDSNTTYIEKSVAHIDMNHGVYIDIFPLDGYPQEISKQKELEKEKTKIQGKISCVYEFTRSPKERIGCFFRRIVGYHKKTNELLTALDEIISKNPITEESLVCNHGNWQGKLEYAPYEQYGDGIWRKFEGIDVRVPAKYDEYLTQKYGQWKQELPIEKQKGHHFYEIQNLDKPYTFYRKSY